MRPTEYEILKKISPGYLASKSRYVMNSLRSHQRPVAPEDVPISVRPDDDPRTRGLTQEPA